MASSSPIANNPDIRFLGAIVGDVIRAHAGDDVYRTVEAIRRAAVERARTGAGDGPDLAEMKAALKGCPAHLSIIMPSRT